MVHIHEFDPSEIDDEDYEGMPELCDNEDVTKSSDKTKQTSDAKIPEINATVDTPRPVDADGFEDVLGSGRLRKKILVEGDKDQGRPGRGSSAVIRFSERLAGSGAEVWCEDRFVFNVGESEVISGLDLVLPLMYPGEKSLVMIESSFAYGAGGDGDRVPGNSDLEYDLELLEWSELEAVPDIVRDQRMEIGSRKRERGNKHFTRGEYSSAIQCYR